MLLYATWNTHFFFILSSYFHIIAVSLLLVSIFFVFHFVYLHYCCFNYNPITDRRLIEIHILFKMYMLMLFSNFLLNHLLGRIQYLDFKAILRNQLMHYNKKWIFFLNIPQILIRLSVNSMYSLFSFLNIYNADILY